MPIYGNQKAISKEEFLPFTAIILSYFPRAILPVPNKPSFILIASPIYPGDGEFC